MTFGPKWGEITGERSSLKNDNLHDLYTSPNVIRVIKSRIIRWAGQAARVGGQDSCILYFVGET